MSLAGAFQAFDKDGDGLIKLNVLEVTHGMGRVDIFLSRTSVFCFSRHSV